ncbi:MAG: type II secretion system protein [Anaerolineae bacterium]
MKSERGFTLIELLVVIAILAVLFGLTALALTNVGQGAQDAAKDAEKDVVQTAIDVYMAVNNADSITANATGPADKVGPDSSDDFSPYMRRESKYYYCWSSSGRLTQFETADADCVP